MYNLNFSPIFYEKRALYMQKFTHKHNLIHLQFYAKTKKIHQKYPQKYLPRFTPRKTAATRLLPIKRALKTDISLPTVIF